MTALQRLPLVVMIVPIALILGPSSYRVTYGDMRVMTGKKGVPVTAQPDDADAFVGRVKRHMSYQGRLNTIGSATHDRRHSRASANPRVVLTVSPHEPRVAPARFAPPFTRIRYHRSGRPSPFDGGPKDRSVVRESALVSSVFGNIALMRVAISREAFDGS